MKNRKNIFMLVILLMIVGFAAVATTLFINGSTFIAGDQDSFDHDVIFIEAKNESNYDFPISSDGKVITFTTKNLAALNDTDKLLFKVKNKSTQYGANVTIDCSTNSEDDSNLVLFGAYFKGDGIDTDEIFIDRQEVKDGYLNVTLIKNVTEPIDVEFTCELSAKAVEREGEVDVIEENPITKLNSYVLKDLYDVTELEDYSYSKKIIYGTDSIDNAILTLELGEENPTDVMGYLIKKDDDSYELDLVADGRIKPQVMSGFFSRQVVDETTGAEYLDTSLVSDLSGVFYNSQVSNVDLSTWDTSNVTGMNSSFNGATLENVKIGNWDTSNVTSMNEVFSKSNMDGIDIGKWNVSNLTQVNAAFQNSVIKNIDLSKWNPISVLGMSNFFQEANLQNVKIGNWDLSSTYGLSNFFYFTKFDNVQIGFKNLNGVENISGMFSNSEGKKLDISQMDTSNIKSFASMFYNAKIDEIVIGDLDTSNLEVLTSMFTNAVTKSPIDLTNLEVGKVNVMSSMFANFTGPEVDMSGLNFSSMRYLYSPFEDADISTVKMVGTKFDELSYFSNVFNNMTHVDSIDMTNFSGINIEYAHQMFYGSTVKTVKLTNAKLPTATTFTQMFDGCTNLESVDLTGVTAQNVNSITYMFQNCSKLKSIDLTSFDFTNSPNLIADYMFAGTTSLTEVKVSNKFVYSKGTHMFDNSGISQLTVI